MSQMSSVKAERALENRAHVRRLLRLRHPTSAAALASADQDFSVLSAQAGDQSEIMIEHRFHHRDRDHRLDRR